MLQAFVDDSGSESGDRRLFLAGYINVAERWESFSDAWASEIAKPPSLRYFKMAEAENLGGQFKGWSKDQRDEKVMALANIINSHRPWFVHCSVSRSEYARIVAPVAPQPLKSPYFSCFWAMIMTVARYHASSGCPEMPPVDFIFDEQGGAGDQAVMFYRWLKGGQDPIIRDLLGSPPIFRDDKDVVPLQAADMLAWHIRREHESNGTENRPATRLLFTEGASAHVDSKTLEGLARSMRRVPGVKLVQTKQSWRQAKKHMQARQGAGFGPPQTGLARMWVMRTRLRAKDFIARLLHPRR